jgi:predicted secreted hydrolase
VRSKGRIVVLTALLIAGVARAAGPLPALGPGDEGFAQVLGPRAFEFPRDHGAHPEYRQEWWYFTGNLDSGAGERVGFELTFFRFGLASRPGIPSLTARSPGEVERGSAEKSAWRARQIYMAHFAVTDVGRQRFRFSEKASRGGAVGLAGARNSPLRVWVDDWALEDAEDTGDRKFGHWKLHAAEPGYELTLDAEALLAPVLNGDQGFSVKSGEPGAASYYYSIPRVAVRGELIRDGKALEVRGLAWMDREWGSGTLGQEQQGWDWFALQLRDGGSLMFYSLRGRDGRRDPHSAGTWISASGEARPLSADDAQIDVLDYWTNPRGARYPARWRVRVPAVGVDVEVRPVLADQELITGSSRYWEGAVDVVAAGASAGRGYVELVGYGAQ